MEPSTTNSNQTHHTRTTTDHEHEHDHEPLIVKISSPHQEIDGCEKRLKNEPSSQEKPMMSQCKEEVSVVIPEKWGQENLLKDWIDYSTFDELLAPKEAGSAREALVADQARPRELIYHHEQPKQTNVTMPKQTNVTMPKRTEATPKQTNVTTTKQIDEEKS